MLQKQAQSVYASFDRFPTRKGASTHIARFAPCLFDYAGGGLFYVLGDLAVGGSPLPIHQIEGEVEIVRFSRPIENFLERALAFGAYFGQLIEHVHKDLRIAHFRDPWSGVAVLAREHRYASVYEVNALPSIELVHAYPGIAPRTLEKIRQSELYCLDRCSAVVTPSRTTRTLLESLGVPSTKITVIANGADCPEPCARPFDAPAAYILYFGALQSWQGIDTLLRAFSRLVDLDGLSLVICGSQRSRDGRRAERFAAKLGLSERIVWHWALSASELAPWVAHAELSLAPLRECARNVSQGCAPLKILESMAAGTPVIASNLRPVRELMDDGVEGRLVAPDRPAELSRAIRVLLAYPELRRAMGERGRARVLGEFTWQHALDRLRAVYRAIDPVQNVGSSVAHAPSSLLS
jgi:glycosyltransferase involved in cell wall biosynthesis